MTSLRGKLWFGFGGLLLILVIVSTLSVVVLTRYSHALQRVFRENYDSAVYCDAMKDALDRIDVASQRRVWGASSADHDDAATDRARFADNLRRQLQNCTLPGELELSQQLAVQWDAFERAIGQFAAAPHEAQANLYSQQLLPRYQRLKQAAQQVADMNMANMISVDGQARRTLIGVRNAMIVLVSAGTLVAAILVGAVGATILRPLKALTQSAREIGVGNLDLRVDVRSADEVGQLAEAFNAMAAQLREFRRLDHEKLLRAQQTTTLALDSLSDAVLLLSPDGAVEIANRSAREHFGIQPGARLGALKAEWLERLYQAVRQDLRPIEPEGYPSAIQIFDDGRERFLLPHAVPVLEAGGTLIGVMVVLVDVTRLRQADEAKSGLLSTVSHELRTPLTSIRMALALLTGDKLGRAGAAAAVLDERQRKLLTAAREDADRLYRIIENLLNMSRIEAGRANVQPQRMSARDLVAQSVDPLREAFDQKGLALHLDIIEGSVEVLADPNSIGYALTNLLGNALKFTPAGGEVRVVVDREGSSVQFCVLDTGPGIPPEHAGRIFDKFFRLPQENGKPGGTGLGLTIARQIIEAHGGRIAFAPRAPRGSEFSFTLPIAQPQVRESRPALVI